MAAIKDILRIVRGFSPECMTEPGFEDIVGLMVGSELGETETVLCCLDCTEIVVEEAARLGAKLVLSHHPAIFRSIERVTDASPEGRTIMKAVAAGITVYSAHTNLDFCKNGINDYYARLLGLVTPKPMRVDGGVEVGRIGELERSVTLDEYAGKVAVTFKEPCLRYCGEPKKIIKKVACVNGGGGDREFIDEALALGADCYVSSDFSYHAWLYARESGLPVIEMNHYSAEHVYVPEYVRILTELAGKEKLNVSFKAAEEKYPITRSIHNEF